ncbi:MAG: hypothetical protein NVSMB10_13450 [Steroidobacteraceae bacterium]
MSNDKKKPQFDSDGSTDPSSRREAPVVNNNTGRVRFDDRGNAVWEWAHRSDSPSTDTTTKRLKQLDLGRLALKDDAAQRAQKRPAPGVLHGYSPYDSGVLNKPPATGNRKKDLRRLSEWLKLRAQVSKNKQSPDED